MNLRIGIADDHPGWESLLAQEGLSTAFVRDLPSSNQFSVIVAGDRLNYTEMRFMQKFLRGGGAVLCSTRAFALMTRQLYQGDYVQFVLAGDEPFHDASAVDLYASCQMLPQANVLKTNNGKLSAFVGEYESGNVVVLPFDPAELTMRNDSVTKSFYSEERRLPFERVSAVDKSGLRKLVSAGLRYLHHRRSLPYCHVWYYPRDEQTLFAFRVDSDFGSSEQVRTLDAVSHRHQVPLSWFVDVQSQQPHLDVYRTFKGHEVGIHCFSHRWFRSAAEFERDLRTAMTVFELSGMTSPGVAAPYGQWSMDVGSAMNRCRFEYSSEFAYDYDNVPSFPQIDNGMSSVLQVPIHPISIGSLNRHGYSNEQVQQYFRHIIDTKRAARDPLFLFHHPRDGREEVVEWLLKRIREGNIPLTRLIDYARWWKKRLEAIPALTFDEGRLQVQSRAVAEDVYLRIVHTDGTESFTPLTANVDVPSLPRKFPPAPMPLPADYWRTKEYNYRIPLVKGLDAVAGVLRAFRQNRVRRLKGQEQTPSATH